ncbi:deoxyguanosinetriphosphate triphosphohydrolase [Isachenkonia alkalipeptolytica]|uniref:Deoxyguanosinetriphosphate triphosphohydrolase n=1 Tax=Isachenkonia alkalipeptolytica TaxID=2565777 RepID=A0AA43XKC9_9CLOT|nr:deoxyguanosinetriphosphate triphosphohydrolase [Isachenkonia alkalipeptolytica]NBG88495.1 deoxyguanosinetriphosphate triphosphohydrolase [Isachenkonia alkalipeptolytica]
MEYNIRQESEAVEKKILSPYAMHSIDSKGRKKYVEPCEIRTIFQRDRDRIIHSKSFRKLKEKTQVFIVKDDFFRTRLTHVLEVSQIARTVARALRLNEDLVEAISLGHDLGHTCFGHSGEDTLKEITGHFKHNEQSLRVVDKLEKQRRGLNLSFEVRDGILNHTGREYCKTLEGNVVKIVDRITYLCHDIQDSLSVGVLRESEIPKDLLAYLGHTHSERVNTLTKDLIIETRKILENPNVGIEEKIKTHQSEEAKEMMAKLRSFMFTRVYRGDFCSRERKKAHYIIEFLFSYFLNHPEELPEKYRFIAEEEGLERGITDFIAGCTDGYIIKLFKDKFIPTPR